MHMRAKNQTLFLILRDHRRACAGTQPDEEGPPVGHLEWAFQPGEISGHLGGVVIHADFCHEHLLESGAKG